MNRKILAIAVTAAMVSPIVAVQADVTLGGVIQGEVVTADVKAAREDPDKSDYQTYTKDYSGAGAVYGGGPNKITIGFDEKLGGGLSAFGKYDASFSTMSNQGFGKREAYLGLKGDIAWFLLGTKEGAYKNSFTRVDPFAGTSLQARAFASGMTSSRFGHSSFIDNIIEVGFKGGGFSAQLQGIFDERPQTYDAVTGNEFGWSCISPDGKQFADVSTPYVKQSDGWTCGQYAEKQDGAALAEFKYDWGNGDVFIAGSWTDFSKESIKSVANQAIGSEKDNQNGQRNLKAGGRFVMGPMTLALQYEDAELGTMDWDINPDGGKYGLLSAAYRVNNVEFAGWLAGYWSNIEDANKEKKIDNNGKAELINEDALSWTLGAKYYFSKRSLVYAGYHELNSDNDRRDLRLFNLGIKHTF